METVEFFVPGIARPQTRPKTFRNPKTGGVVTSSSSKPVRNWRERIYVEAQVVKPPSPWEGPVSMTAIFVFSRPAGHYRKNGELSASTGCVADAPRIDRQLETRHLWGGSRIVDRRVSGCGPRCGCGRLLDKHRRRGLRCWQRCRCVRSGGQGHGGERWRG